MILLISSIRLCFGPIYCGFLWRLNPSPHCRGWSPSKESGPSWQPGFPREVLSGVFCCGAAPSLPVFWDPGIHYQFSRDLWKPTPKLKSVRLIFSSEIQRCLQTKCTTTVLVSLVHLVQTKSTLGSHWSYNHVLSAPSGFHTDLSSFERRHLLWFPETSFYFKDSKREHQREFLLPPESQSLCCVYPPVSSRGCGVFSMSLSQQKFSPSAVRYSQDSRSKAKPS